MVIEGNERGKNLLEVDLGKLDGPELMMDDREGVIDAMSGIKAEKGGSALEEGRKGGGFQKFEVTQFLDQGGEGQHCFSVINRVFDVVIDNSALLEDNEEPESRNRVIKDFAQKCGSFGLERIDG